MNVFVRLALRLALGLAIFAPTAATAQLQTLYVFPGGPPKHTWAAVHGALPVSGLVRSGPYLYGTTEYGANSNAGCGGQGCGTVFRLDPVSGKLSTIYEFCAVASCADGSVPLAGLAVDGAGALYGTTAVGGNGSGTVFKLAPPAVKGGAWTETVVYTFCSLNPCSDGAYPRAGLTFDTNGLLYGTTNQGALGYGTVFKLDPSNGTLTTLHTFTAGTDGASPTAGVVFGKGGDLYGTTNQGAGSQTESCQAPTYPAFCGTVFRLDPIKKVLTTLFTFNAVPCQDGVNNCYPYGRYPFANLVVGKLGVLFGTTSAGGAAASCGANGGCGTVFELTPPAVGQKTWTETVLHSFCSQTNCAEGASPLGPLVLDRIGLLYGTAAAYGVTGQPFPNDGGFGAVFELDPTSQALTTLYVFGGVLGACPGPCTTYHPNGSSPTAGLTIHYSADGAFVLYGTTEYGGGSQTNGCNGYGSDSCGTVFALTP
jgi:uncharacterized repeat protein (TIGR03803 family)